MPDTDVLLIGGGLAGLSASILLARAGFSVTLLEKDDYPRHKVCGEYVGNESRPFLERLGLDADGLHLPRIHRLQLSDGRGRTVEAPLQLGGLGISRYALDAALRDLAVAAGVAVQTRCKVTAVQRLESAFSVEAGGRTLTARVVLGAWGKRANLDAQFERPHLRGADPRLDGWVGIKHHIRIDHPDDQIALHNFAGGYCGMSRVEDGRTCLCYLVRGEALRRAGGRIDRLEQTVLRRNPHLDRVWREAEFLFEKPLAISQVSFQKRQAVEDGVLVLGDAAGLIAPLCGNGMSMAFGAAQLAGQYVPAFLRGELSHDGLEAAYRNAWQQRFGRRLKAGRLLQARFGGEALTAGFIGLLRAFPFLKRPLIRATHGVPF